MGDGGIFKLMEPKIKSDSWQLGLPQKRRVKIDIIEELYNPVFFENVGKY